MLGVFVYFPLTAFFGGWDESNYVSSFSQKVSKVTKVEEFVLSLLDSIYTLETTQNGPGQVIF